MEQLAALFPEAEVFLAKELTKIHERYFKGSALDATRQLHLEIQQTGPVGEWCFGIRYSELQRGHAALSDQEGGSETQWVKALECLFDAGVSASEAAYHVSQRFGAPKKTVYEKALKLFGKKT